MINCEDAVFQPSWTQEFEGDPEERWHLRHWGQTPEEDIDTEKKTQLTWDWMADAQAPADPDPVPSEERRRLLIAAIIDELMILSRELRRKHEGRGTLGESDSNLSRINKFLTEIYRLSDANGVHEAGDLIYNFVQGALRSAEFEFCDRLLDIADPTRLRPALRITFLSMTLNAKTRLAMRNRYLQRVRAAFALERGEESASNLLNKYE